MHAFFLIILVFGCALMFVNLVFATLQKPSTMQTHIIIALVCIILMFTGYYIELKATSLEIAYLGTVVSYIGKPFILFHCLMVICTFYEFKVSKGLYLLASGIGALIFLAVFTNPQTHLYYKTVAFDTTGAHPVMIMENGALYWIHTVTLVLYFLACTIISIFGYIKHRNTRNAKFTVYMVLMAVFGLAGYIFYLTGLSKGYDTTVFGALAGVICLSILFYRFRLLDGVSLAKDSALESSITGIVVIDEDKKIAYVNQVGRRFLEAGFSTEILLAQVEHQENYTVGEHVYRVSRKEIEHKGQYLCDCFEINDITVSANYQARLELEVQERAEKIESIQRKTVASLANVVEVRSLETGQHIARTSEFSALIASELGKTGKYKERFNEAYVVLLSDATPLHDVGKISVPDSILLKPGKLDEAEFEEMKKHSESGAAIIESVMRGVEEDDYVDMAIAIARYHHERWDGKGYPYGLKGAAIPIEARIVAVADCFDALTSDRCYKKAFSVEKSLGILREESGTHFDPEVVEAFIMAYNKKN